MTRVRARSRVAVAFAVTVGLGTLVLACSNDEDSPLTPQRVTKTVAISGGVGSGRVTSSDGKIDCRLTNSATGGPTCSAAFDSGSVATLTATPDAGSEFVAWSGDCTGTTCQLSVTRDLTASPRFVPTQVELTVELTTPNNDDGAILFTITGPSILGLTPSSGLEVLENRITSNGATTSTALLRGNLASGTIAQLVVRGADLDASYTTQVAEVAGRATAGYAQRTDLAAYRITVKR